MAVSISRQKAEHGGDAAAARHLFLAGGEVHVIITLPAQRQPAEGFEKRDKTAAAVIGAKTVESAGLNVGRERVAAP